MEEKYKPQAYHVARWSEDPYSLGSWSQLLVNGTPEDRTKLGSPFSTNLILAGEACDPDFPAMVVGAVNSGKSAAEWAVEGLQDGENVVIIGAGAAGISAANRIKELNSNIKVQIVEARDRIGGRIHTISFEDKRHSSTAENTSNIKVDAGATWLHHFTQNHLADIAQKHQLQLIKTDFHNCLNASKDGPADQVRSMIEVLSVELQRVIQNNKNEDLSVEIALSTYLKTLSQNEQQLAWMALEEIRADSGIDYSLLSAKYALEEPGVGRGDYYMKDGYSNLLHTLIPEDVDILLNTPITLINWSTPSEVVLESNQGEIITANRCICTLPISLLQANKPQFSPNLPEKQKLALNKMKISMCDKVILQYSTRWWPSVPGKTILHWFNNSLTNDINWVEWLDMTDDIGSPVLMAFIAGEDTIKKYHGHRSDEEIAYAATYALQEWSQCYLKQQEQISGAKLTSKTRLSNTSSTNKFHSNNKHDDTSNNTTKLVSKLSGMKNKKQTDYSILEFKLSRDSSHYKEVLQQIVKSGAIVITDTWK